MKSFSIELIKRILYFDSFEGYLTEGTCLILMCFVRNPFVGILLLTIGVGTSGLIVSGWHLNHQDLSQRYASIIAGFTALIGTSAGIISPIVAGILTKDQVNVSSHSISSSFIFDLISLKRISTDGNRFFSSLHLFFIFVRYFIFYLDRVNYKFGQMENKNKKKFDTIPKDFLNYFLLHRRLIVQLNQQRRILLQHFNINHS